METHGRLAAGVAISVTFLSPVMALTVAILVAWLVA